MGYITQVNGSMMIIGGVLTPEVSLDFRKYGEERELSTDDGFERLLTLKERYGSADRFPVRFDGPHVLNPGFTERYRIVASLFDEAYVLWNHDGCFDTVVGVGPPETIAPLVDDLTVVGGRSFMRHQPVWFKEDLRRYLESAFARSNVYETLVVMPWMGGVATE